MLTTEKSKPANQSTVRPYTPELLPFRGIYNLHIIIIRHTVLRYRVALRYATVPYTPHHERTSRTTTTTAHHLDPFTYRTIQDFPAPH